MNPLPTYAGDTEWDELVPNGWLKGFVDSLRGTINPTKFSLWSGIFALSSAVKRESWLKWYPENLYPNFYIIIVAPPKLCAKSTGLVFAGNILSGFENEFLDPRLKVLKRVNLYRSRVSPEGLIDIMMPTSENVMVGAGMAEINRGSQASLLAAELGTLFGKQRYNIGLIDKLTNLYDCPEHDDDVTVSKGHQKLEQVFLTIGAATTATFLEDSLPPEAYGEGFMSRVVVVRQDIPTRHNKRPFHPPGSLTKEDLRTWLARLCISAVGEYTLDTETDEYYGKWYDKFIQELSDEDNDHRRLLMHRYDIHLLKLAMLLRTQREPAGKLIELSDFQLAEKILAKTYGDMSFLVRTADLSGGILKTADSARRLLSRRGTVCRRDMLKALSPTGVTTGMLAAALDHLFAQGEIKVLIGATEIGSPKHGANEIYRRSDVCVKS